MIRRAMIPNMIKVMLVVLTISLFCLVGPGIAGQKGTPMPAHYPEQFTAVGCIDRMDDDFIVVDDLAIKYANKAKFYISENPNPVSLKYFRAGRKVGLVFNSNHQIESMYFLGKCR